MAGPTRENEVKSIIQKEVKAASAASYSRLFIGQDQAGHWVVKDCSRTGRRRSGLQCMNANAALNP
jgi:hypothetical protein